MLTAIKSDFTLLRDQLKSLILVFAFMLSMAYLQKSTSFIFFYASFMSFFIPFSLASLDEQSGWDAVLLCTPVSRVGMVRGRYAVCLIYTCVVTLVGFAVATLMMPGIENLYAVLVSLAITLLFIGILLPVIYKLGSHKARYVLMVLSLLPSLLFFIADGLNPLRLFVEAYGQALQRAFTSIPFLLTIDAVCLFILALSCSISSYIYGKKEF